MGYWEWGEEKTKEEDKLGKKIGREKSKRMGVEKKKKQERKERKRRGRKEKD